MRTDANGRETFYGTWYANGRRIKRRIGTTRTDDTNGLREGLTLTQAEGRLQRLMLMSRPNLSEEPLTIGHLGYRYLEHSGAISVESILRIWLVPFFAERDLRQITERDVFDLIAMMRNGDRPDPNDRYQGRPLSPKSIRNYIGTLSTLLTFAERRGWLGVNVAKRVAVAELVESPTKASDRARYTAEELESYRDAIDHLLENPVPGNQSRPICQTAGCWQDPVAHDHCTRHLATYLRAQGDGADCAIRNAMEGLYSSIVELAATAVLPYARAMRALVAAQEIFNLAQTADGRTYGVPLALRGEINLTPTDPDGPVNWSTFEGLDYAGISGVRRSVADDPLRTDSTDHIRAAIGSVENAVLERRNPNRIDRAPSANRMIDAGLLDKLNAILVYIGAEE